MDHEDRITCLVLIGLIVFGGVVAFLFNLLLPDDLPRER